MEGKELREPGVGRECWALGPRASCLDGVSLLPVFQESLQTDARERVIEESVDYGRGTCSDVRTHSGRLDDVYGMAATGNQHIGCEVVVVVNLDDISNQ